MARSLKTQTKDFQAAMVGLLKLYQFRDRNETVAYGLSVSQAYALRALAESGALAMSGLAEELKLTVSSKTHATKHAMRRIELAKRRVSFSANSTNAWTKCGA